MVYFMIKILVLIFSVASFAANEPMFIKNQQGGAKEKIRDFQAPNNLATKLTAEQFLVETGNNNILSNPSFEHETVSSSWTDNGTDTGIATAVAVVHGKKAIGFLPVARSVNLIQSSTLYAAQFADGVQGLAMVRIKSDVAVKVCSIQAGTVSTTNCVTTNTDLKWGLYKVPFILGGTSNGISISTNGALVTGTVLVDDAFVGAVDLQAITSFDTTCPTIACETSFSALIVTGGSVQNENVNWLSTQSGTTTKTANFNAGIFTVAPNCTATLYITASPAMSARVLSTTASAVNLQTPDYNGNLQDGSLSLSCNKQGADYTAAIAARAEYQKTQVASYSASCGANCVDVYSAVIASTTTDVVTSENVDFINGNCTTATVGRSTCTFNSGLVTQQLSCSCTTVINAANRSCAVLVQSSTSVLVSTTSGGVEADGIGFNLICQKQGADFVATRNIVGSFNEVVTSPGISKPVFYSSKISSTGVVSNEQGDFISTCTNPSTGIFTCSFNASTFSSTPNCQANINGIISGANQSASAYNESVSSVSVYLLSGSGVSNQPFNLSCHGVSP
jgi:hypothetical protein